PAQTDASIAGLKAAGYDTSGLEKFVNDYRNAKAANNSQVATTTHPTQSTGFFTNAYNAVVSGASNLWDRVTGGSKPVLNSNSLTEGSYNYKPSKESNGVLKPLADGAIIPGKGYNVTSEFGSRPDPFNPTGPSKVHRGLDIGMPIGTPVSATAPGKVIFSGTQNNGSREVHIDHGGGLVSIFKHNSELLVQNGQQVVSGELISKSGNTGPSTGPHLHYELKLNGVVQDPTTFNIRDWKLKQ
ncbi:M23 family metallopeptidase, partial [Leptospira alexanderi]|uniref:M23 family metallopeptidase n=1 Tax=Leptospira alexanderi TaxID=100053 RepID=UPI0011159393